MFKKKKTWKTRCNKKKENRKKQLTIVRVCEENKNMLTKGITTKKNCYEKNITH